MDQATTIRLQTTVTLAITYLIQVIKKSKAFPWFTMQSDKANHILHIVTSFLGTLGIQIATTGLSKDHLLSLLFNFVQTYLLSKGAYHLLLAPTDAKIVSVSGTSATQGMTPTGGK